MHAELTLRGTVLMLGPESAAMGRRTAKSIGASPATLYLYVENVDKVIEKATKLGATSQGPVIDMFWGDRCVPSSIPMAIPGWSARIRPNRRRKR